VQLHAVKATDTEGQQRPLVLQPAELSLDCGRAAVQGCHAPGRRSPTRCASLIARAGDLLVAPDPAGWGGGLAWLRVLHALGEP
jgi:hypothetical protein